MQVFTSIKIYVFSNALVLLLFLLTRLVVLLKLNTINNISQLLKLFHFHFLLQHCSSAFLEPFSNGLIKICIFKQLFAVSSAFFNSWHGLFFFVLIPQLYKLSLISSLQLYLSYCGNVDSYTP